MFISTGRLSSRCSSGRQTSRQSTDVDWYGCDTLGESHETSLPRPHSVAGDVQTSPAWCEYGARARLHTNTPVVSRQSSARARHEHQRRHYIENGVDEPTYDDNDLLQRHRRWFRKERPFTPRTLQSSQVSRLSAMSSCYRNPRRDHSRVDSEDAAEDDVEQGHECGSRPGTSGTMTDSFTYDTLRSRPGRQRQTPTEVPPLGISLDADQMKYLKQMSHREESETVTETALNKTQTDHVTSGPSQRSGTSLTATNHQL